MNTAGLALALIIGARIGFAFGLRRGERKAWQKGFVAGLAADPVDYLDLGEPDKFIEHQRANAQNQ